MSTSKIPLAACSLSTTVASNLRGRSLVVSSNVSILSRNRCMRRATTVAMSSGPLEICVKASMTVPDKLGDCETSSLFASLLCMLYGQFGFVVNLCLLLWMCIRI